MSHSPSRTSPERAGKRRTPTLIQQALILVAVPLVFQVALLGVVYAKFEEAENVARTVSHSKAVITKTDRVIQLLADIGFAFVVYDGKTKPFFERHLNSLLVEVPDEMSDLRNQVSDSPAHVAIVDRVTREVNEQVQVLKINKQAIEAGARLDFGEFLAMRQHLNEIDTDLNIIVADEQKVQQQTLNGDPQADMRLKNAVRQLLIAGVCADIVIGLLLVRILHRGTARRLLALVQNSDRLAMRVPLAPPQEGTDEIAELDQRLYDAAAALVEATRKEKAAIDNSADVICQIDNEGKFSAVSPACLKLWGYEPEELIGKNWIDIVLNADSSENEKAMFMLRQNRGGAETSFENRVLRKDNSQIDMLWSAYWSETEQAIFCVAHDISERKQLERFKQEFVAMISHDLRTPLMAVQSTLTLLETGAWGELTAKGHKKVNSAENNITRSVDLINNLLDLEKMASGKMEMNMQCVELRRLMDRCVDAVSTLAERRQIKVLIERNSAPDEIDELDDIEIRADGNRLSQVLINLLGNAVKFSNDNSQVTVSAKIEPEHVSVVVSDRGPGIPGDLREKIFEKYYQLPSAALDSSDSLETQKPKGSGLGLAICKAIVDAHEGTIGVDSDEGKGSQFWFRIPRIPVETIIS